MHLLNPRACSTARGWQTPSDAAAHGAAPRGTPRTSQHGSASTASVLRTLPIAPGQNIQPARGGHADLLAKAKKKKKKFSRLIKLIEANYALAMRHLGTEPQLQETVLHSAYKLCA